MTKLEHARLIEIKFYYTILDLLDICKNIYIVCQLIDSLAALSEYNPEQVKKLAIDILDNPAKTPTAAEAIYTLRLGGEAIFNIIQRTKKYQKYVYQILEQPKDKMYITPKYLSAAHTAMIQFMKTINKFKKVGDNCGKHTLGPN